MLYPVHPRVHGELAYAGVIPLAGTGSSPRTRGTLLLGFLGGADTRFIPAYTGNSTPRTMIALTAAVHPRVHGELALETELRNLIAGSSPRTRGTLFLLFLSYHFHRFIPAYTGNSSVIVGGVSIDPVHPRVHGELLSGVTSHAVPPGSSPRTRGTLPTQQYYY